MRRIIVLAALVASGCGLLATQVYAQPAAIDHFLVYSVRSPKGTPRFSPVTGITLVDQFERLDVTARRVDRLAVPTNKNGEGILDPSTHLTGYKITPVKGQARHAPRTIQVTNQFGTVVLVTKPAARLLVPASKGLTSYLPAPTFSSHQVDHYKCHKVGLPRGTRFTPIVAVSVVDQFQSKKIDVLRPNMICNPAEKRYQNAVYPVKHPNDHLLCYRIRATPGEAKNIPTTVYVADQFGQVTRKTVRERELCVPSSKTVIAGPPPPTHTSTPTYTYTYTHTPTYTPAPTYTPTGTPTGTAMPIPTATAASTFTATPAATPTPLCGNGIVDAGESCDPPMPLDTDCDSQICSPTCQIVIVTATCGDGCLRPQDGEQCDPPGSPSCPGGVACLAGCHCPGAPFIIDSFFDVFYRIDLPGCPGPGAPQQHASGPGHIKQGSQQDPGDGRLVAPIEIVGMSLVGTGVTMTERPGGSNPNDPPCTAGAGCSGGQTKQQAPGSDTPSNGLLALQIVLDQGGQTLVNQNPISLQGVVNGYLIANGTLNGTACVPLEDVSHPGPPVAYIVIDTLAISSGP